MPASHWELLSPHPDAKLTSWLHQTLFRDSSLANILFYTIQIIQMSKLSLPNSSMIVQSMFTALFTWFQVVHCALTCSHEWSVSRLTSRGKRPQHPHSHRTHSIHHLKSWPAETNEESTSVEVRKVGSVKFTHAKDHVFENSWNLNAHLNRPKCLCNVVHTLFC